MTHPRSSKRNERLGNCTLSVHQWEPVQVVRAEAICSAEKGILQNREDSRIHVYFVPLRVPGLTAKPYGEIRVSHTRSRVSKLTYISFGTTPFPRENVDVFREKRFDSLFTLGAQTKLEIMYIRGTFGLCRPTQN